MVYGAKDANYDQALADVICERISTGDNLTNIVKTEGMPCKPDIYRWLARNEPFRKQYNEALVLRLETKQDEFAQRIADTPDDKDALKKLEIWIKNEVFWLAKINPQKYGDNLTIKGDADNPIQINLAAALDARIAAARAAPVIEHEAALPVVDAITSE